MLTWTGVVSPSLKVTANYVMTTSGEITSCPRPFSTTALINDGAGHLLTRTAMAIVNGYVIVFASGEEVRSKAIFSLLQLHSRLLLQVGMSQHRVR
jgi:hypothetical protein